MTSASISTARRAAVVSDHDTTLLEVPHRSAPDVRLRHLRHLDRRHGARGDASAFESVLQGQGVDHRREHAHVVAGGAVEPAVAGGQAAEDVATANHQRYLHAHLMHALHLGGDRLYDLEIDAVITRAAERLAAELQQDAVELRRPISHLSHLCLDCGPILSAGSVIAFFESASELTVNAYGHVLPVTGTPCTTARK